MGILHSYVSLPEGIIFSQNLTLKNTSRDDAMPCQAMLPRRLRRQGQPPHPAEQPWDEMEVSSVGVPPNHAVMDDHGLSILVSIETHGDDWTGSPDLRNDP